ncbi:RNA polymerase sigma factor [Leucobacter viscericola]|uniref:RNA polymerase sigma factor n=1 Tax=Leucobacter viscericola TaxID=2714935 RepID=A0A6G7XFA1_9MICO|nr:RNA polymerase sigma factor [Leucobacter viscericola]QIK63290.1 RNA polymerase sigma factor [Leucobacter viscericola]
MQSSTSAAMSDEAFGELFDQLRPKLVGYAHGYVRDSAASEDVVSEAFLSVLAMIRKGAGPTPETFLSYMRVCIRNESINYGKRVNREVATDELADLLDAEANVDPDLVGNETWDEGAISRAYAALPQRAQQVLWLAEVDGEKMADIGEALEISPQAVATAAFRAREALRLNYLVEVTAGESACASLPQMYLAQSVLNVVPSKRAKRVARHLEECAHCTATAKRMRSISLPVNTLVVVAASGALMHEIVWGAAPASATTGAAAGTTVTTAWFARKGVIAIMAGAGALVIAIGLLLLNAPVNSDAARDSGTSGTAHSAGGSTVQDQGSTSSPKKQGETKAPPTKPKSDKPSSNTDSGTNNSGDGNSGGGDADVELPPGVRSLDWANGDHIALLNVRFDQSTRPDAYSVTVTAPPGVSILNASAGCEVSGSTAVCIPDPTFVGLDDYNWKFQLSDETDGFPKAQIARL